MKTTTIRFAGVEWTGKNKREALAEADQRLAQAIAGDWRPIVLCAGGLELLGWRTPETGWGYLTRETGKRDGRGELQTTCFGPTAPRATVAELMRRHMAQLLIGKSAHDGLEVLENPKDRQEHARYVGWQRAIGVGRQVAGIRGDDALRAYADEHAAEHVPNVAEAPIWPDVEMR